MSLSLRARTHVTKCKKKEKHISKCSRVRVRKEEEEIKKTDNLCRRNQEGGHRLRKRRLKDIATCVGHGMGRIVSSVAKLTYLTLPSLFCCHLYFWSNPDSNLGVLQQIRKKLAYLKISQTQMPELLRTRIAIFLNVSFLSKFLF